jgi:hypothetical protein
MATNVRFVRQVLPLADNFRQETTHRRRDY